jgi:phenylpropionate dioxygenase-like ring-hydroxylating dioxygenase large terminal subunit
MHFAKNCWYVAAWSGELGSKPVCRKIIGETVLLFRKQDRSVVALDDTCPHRFAPLHKGVLVDDLIECPYHGLRFDALGACAHNPHAPGVKPAAARLRSYPIVERDRFIWIWMGTPELADASAIPDFHWLNEVDKYTLTSDAQMRQSLNYVLITDNLLDLSHGQFLHPTTLGNTAMAGGTASTRQVGHRIHYDRWNPDGEAPTLFTVAGAATPGSRVDFWNEMRWDPPGSFYLEVGITATGEAREKGVFLGSAHLLTPEDDTHTVYRYILFRTFSRDDPNITPAIEALVAKAFTEEDEPMISAIQERMAGRDFWSLRPVLLAGDKAAVLARRTLDSMIETERSVAGTGDGYRSQGGRVSEASS